MALTANLIVFAACAAFAFARNTQDLFGDFDGRYMLTEMRNQFALTLPSFSYSNDFLQSIGNIRFLQNSWPLPVYWPVGWFSDFNVGRVIAYLLIAVFVFLSAYGLARQLSQGRLTALAAGWILGVVITPFVPYPFFCPMLMIAPSSFLLVCFPVLVFWLVRRIGQSTLVADALAALGLMVVLLYLLAINPPVLILLVVGLIPYTVIILLLVRRRAELIRKLAVVAVVLVVATCLRWPWYLLGLISYSAPLTFPADFTLPGLGPAYISILFQGHVFGQVGPALVATAVGGALLSLRRHHRELRAAAYVMLAFVILVIAARLSYLVFGDWSRFSPFYIEIAIWPLYGVFSAVALHRVVTTLQWAIGAAVPRPAEGGPVLAGFGALAAWLLPLPAAVIAVMLALSQSPAQTVPFPPRTTAMVDVLRADIALARSSPFRGRVATIIPVDPSSVDDPWLQQFNIGQKVWRATGNDQMSIGLWYYRIPTLFVYNQALSPVFHALIKRTLQRPALAHTRNIEIYTHADARMLKLFGVRYVILPQDKSAIGELRKVEEIDGQSWGLFELSEPNLGTYSPTSVEVRSSLASILDFMADESVDLTKTAVVRAGIDGPFVPAETSSLSVVDGDLHIVARSAGRSLLVVPLEFSHCLELHNRLTNPGDGEASLVRVDGTLTGIVFERRLDTVLAFRTGPLQNPTCRWKDYRELQEMLR